MYTHDVRYAFWPGRHFIRGVRLEGIGDVPLGAQSREVLSAALGRPARLLVLGSIAGPVSGMLARRWFAHLVYGATAEDPEALAGVVLSMALLALGATWLPGSRALSVEPASLLPGEQLASIATLEGKSS
jgi:hypothetical protein